MKNKKRFFFISFKNISDEKYNELEELEKINKEREEYNKNKKKYLNH